MSGLHTWKKDKSTLCYVHVLLFCHSRWMGSYFFVVHVCVRGDVDPKATVLNMCNKCSLCECFSPTWLHAGVITPWILLSAQPSLHLFKCSHSSHSLFAKWRKKNKKLSTHNHRGGCQILCLLYTFCLTVQSFFKMAVDCGTTSTGFKGEHEVKICPKTYTKDTGDISTTLVI